MENCLFCKIIRGEIPCYKIYEDEDVLAFLDINGKVAGHTLVIPKSHCINILDADEGSIKNVICSVKKIANHYVNDKGFTGFNLQVNNGKSAGQEVGHMHFHILPRGNVDLNGKTLEEICEYLKIN
ncbi:MAG: HIT family protein [Christensenellales bacterium]